MMYKSLATLNRFDTLCKCCKIHQTRCRSSHSSQRVTHPQKAPRCLYFKRMQVNIENIGFRVNWESKLAKRFMLWVALIGKYFPVWTCFKTSADYGRVINRNKFKSTLCTPYTQSVNIRYFSFNALLTLRLVKSDCLWARNPLIRVLAQ